jgi:hypothetical protein
VDDDASDDNFTVLQSNREYFLTQDEDGYAIWSVRSDNEDPVLTFPAGEESSEDALAAFRRETRSARWASLLFVSAIAAGGAWVLSRLIQEGLQLADVPAAFPNDSPTPVPFSWRFLAYVELTLPVLYAVFIVSVGLSVVLWLHRRFRREG